MKLYYFNPNNYDLEFFVMAESKEDARQSLLKYLKEKINEEIKNNTKYSFYDNYLKKWEKVDIEDKSTYPNKYTLDIYEPNMVIESEIA